MISIYKASAGSGKTFTLAYEYIRLLLASKEDSGRYRLANGKRSRHRNILAITFTNKASDEMKSRILHELALLARRVPGWTGSVPYRDMLMKELRCSADSLAEAAGNALNRLLFDFHYFQVSTIDSFFQTILRTFAREVDLPGDYEINLESGVIIRQAVNDMLDSLTDSHNSDSRMLIRWITRYMQECLRKGKNSAILNRASGANSSLVKFFTALLNDELSSHFDSMRRYFTRPELLTTLAQTLGDREDATAKPAIDAARAAVNAITTRGYQPEKGKKICVKSYLYNDLVKASQGIIAPGKETVKVADGDASYGVTGLQKQLQRTPDPELDEIVNRACALCVSAASDLSTLHHILNNLFYMGLFGRVLRNIEAMRTDANTMLLSDTTNLLHDIISDDDAPFVYERIGVRLKHFLIDEFQDTSRMQWENLRPLIAEGLAHGAESLIIGDVKQSIYRFRYGDPSLLDHEVAEQFSDKSATIGSGSDDNTNYRSAAQIVDFNNNLFAHMAGTLGFDRQYANVKQRIHLADLTGYVDILELPASAKPGERHRTMALDNMTKGIIRQLRAGYMPKDIAILVYTRAEGACVIDHILHHRNEYPELARIDVISDDAMFLGNSPVVKAIISIMRFIYLASEHAVDNAGTDGSTAKSRRRRIRQLIYRYHHYLSHNATTAGQALREALDSDSDPEADYMELANMMSMDTFNLQSLIEQIIEKYILPMDEGRIATEQNLYICAFVDAVGDFCAAGTPDLHSFLEWWDTAGSTVRVSSPEQNNALRVMTIHKSKGLEFSCVHIPFVSRQLAKFGDIEWYPTGNRVLDITGDFVPELLPLQPQKALLGTQFEEHYNERCRQESLETLNLAYVAFTRACRELSVCTFARAAETTGSLLTLALRHIDWDNTVAEEDNTRYTIGTPTVPAPAEQRKVKVTDPHATITMPAYTTKARPELWDNLKLDRRLDFFDERQHGTILHSLLQHIRRPSDIDKAVRLAVYRHLLPKDKADEIRLFITDSIASVAARHWFEGYRWVVTERTVLLADGTTARPDRIVGLPDGTVDVVDFKFGEQKDTGYIKQVRGYIDLLKRTGLQHITGYIWYVTTGEIVEV